MPADGRRDDAERVIRDALLRAEAGLDLSKPFAVELAADRIGNLARTKAAVAQLDVLCADRDATIAAKDAEIAQLYAQRDAERTRVAVKIAEIADLRGSYDHLSEINQMHMKQIAALRAENERLRAVLSHITNGNHDWPGEMRLIAERALTPPQEPQG